MVKMAPTPILKNRINILRAPIIGYEYEYHESNEDIIYHILIKKRYISKDQMKHIRMINDHVHNLILLVNWMIHKVWLVSFNRVYLKTGVSDVDELELTQVNEEIKW